MWHSGYFVSSSKQCKFPLKGTTLTLVPWEENEALRPLPHLLSAWEWLASTYQKLMLLHLFIASATPSYATSQVTSWCNTNRDWTRSIQASDAIALKAFPKVSSFNAASRSLLGLWVVTRDIYPVILCEVLYGSQLHFWVSFLWSSWPCFLDLPCLPEFLGSVWIVCLCFDLFLVFVIQFWITLNNLQRLDPQPLLLWAVCNRNRKRIPRIWFPIVILCMLCIQI